MNNKGVIFSAYIYVLLVFFLLSLAGLLLVLNNTKMLSDKAKEGSGGIVNQSNYDFSIELIGDSNVCLNLGDEYSEPGFTAKDKDGNELPVVIDSNLDIWKSGTYAINYTTKYKNKDKTISRKVIVLKNDYVYTGNSQEFITGCDGYFKVELWGASGGNATYTTLYTGGLGAYTSGEIHLKKNEKLYIYVGGQGQTVSGTTSGTLTANGNGYNGGAPGSFAASNSTHGGGGGSTDIRFVSGIWNNSIGLNSRIMVAGGGGGASSHSVAPSYSGNGGSGGNLIGGKAINGSDTCYAYGTGGTNISGGASTTCVTDGHAYAGVATFGVGHSPFSVYTSTGGYNAGGGGGYYGGGSGYHAGAGGGSSYISGYSGANAITSDLTLTHSNNTLHYSNKYFIDGYMESGINIGNGKAKITYIGKNYEKKNTKLENVRYIKDCMNGSTLYINSIWVEIQAIKDGVNLAYGKKPIGTTTEIVDKPHSNATDGNIMIDSHAYNPGYQCLTVDLGKTYDLDEVMAEHYYDGRAFYSNGVYVSNNNTNWTAIKTTSTVEVPEGKKVSSYQEPIEVDLGALNNVRYVRDCINGSTASVANHWVELQALSEGMNVALGKTAVGTSPENPTYPYSEVTDGEISTVNHAQSSATGLQCITVDLGNIYNLDEITVWHYYGNERTYTGNVTYVSNNNNTWVPVLSMNTVENMYGKTVKSPKEVLTVSGITIPVKYAFGAKWARVFYHNNQSGTQLFASDAEVLSVNTMYKQSVLSNITQFKGSDNKYEFLLQFSEVNGYNRWKQTNNPKDDNIADGAVVTATGYEAISISFPGSGWGGLTLSTSNASTYIDGSVGTASWWYALGCKVNYSNGIPGPNVVVIPKEVELWVRIP